jgi:hypothetical protein
MPGPKNRVSRTIRELLLDYYVGESEKYARMTRDDFGRIYKKNG